MLIQVPDWFTGVVQGYELPAEKDSLLKHVQVTRLGIITRTK